MSHKKIMIVAALGCAIMSSPSFAAFDFFKKKSATPPAVELEEEHVRAYMFENQTKHPVMVVAHYNEKQYLPNDPQKAKKCVESYRFCNHNLQQKTLQSKWPEYYKAVPFSQIVDQDNNVGSIAPGKLGAFFAPVGVRFQKVEFVPMGGPSSTLIERVGLEDYSEVIDADKNAWFIIRTATAADVKNHKAECEKARAWAKGNWQPKEGERGAATTAPSEALAERICALSLKEGVDLVIVPDAQKGTRVKITPGKISQMRGAVR